MGLYPLRRYGLLFVEPSRLILFHFLFYIVHACCVGAIYAAPNQATARPAGINPSASVAGYGRIDPFAKQVNPFLSESDHALVLGANANGNNGSNRTASLASGPIPQRKLAFDPRFQRGPWDPSAKQPRAHNLAPTLRPPVVLKVDWDKEDGVEPEPLGASAALLHGADLIDELPPPPGQTFDAAERLEAERDLPPGLWEPKEYVAGAYGRGGVGGADGAGAGGADRFAGLWPNTGPHHTKVQLGEGGRDLGSGGALQIGEYGLSGDPLAPDPLHPEVSADYTKPGSAVMGVAGQSSIRHPYQIMGPGTGADSGSRDARRRDAAQKRIARTVAAEVKVKPGLEHQQPKVFHSHRTGLAFSSKAELKRYEKVHAKFGEYGRFSTTPQLGRDPPPQLSDGGALAIATEDAAATMRSTGTLAQASFAEEAIDSSSKRASSKDVGAHNIGMGGLSLGAKLQAELETLAAVARASSIMTGAVQRGQPGAYGAVAAPKMTPTLRTRSRRSMSKSTIFDSTSSTPDQRQQKPVLASALRVPSSQFFGDSRGESTSSTITRRQENGDLYQEGSAGLGLLSLNPRFSTDARITSETLTTRTAGSAGLTLGPDSTGVQPRQTMPAPGNEGAVHFENRVAEQRGSDVVPRLDLDAAGLPPEEIGRSSEERHLNDALVSLPSSQSTGRREDFGLDRVTNRQASEAPIDITYLRKDAPFRGRKMARSDDTLGTYYSSDEESQQDEDSADRQEAAPVLTRALSRGLPGAATRHATEGAEATALETADAVRTSLICCEVDAAAKASDYETLVELLVIAKAMPLTSPTAMHALVRIAELLEHAAVEEKLAEAAQAALDAAADADEDRAWELAAARCGETIELKERRRRVEDRAKRRQRARAESNEKRGGRGARGRRPFEAMSDAGLAEGCVDVMRSREADWSIQVAAARVLTSLCAPMDQRGYERVLQDAGAGRALADAARKHGQTPSADSVRDACRDAARAMGLGTPPDVAAAMIAKAAADEAKEGSRRRSKEGNEVAGVVDPLTALLRDRRFFDERMMRAASRG